MKTPQAVLDLLVSPVSGKPLTVDRAGDRLVTADGMESWPIVDGIPDFVQRRDRDGFGELVRQQGRVKQSWHSRRQELFNDPWLQGLGRRIARPAGTILELAAGPGGGNLISILHSAPATMVLVNDISRIVLEEWQRVLQEEDAGENVALAAFDARCMPLRSASIDAVSNGFGIANIPGYDDVLREIYRVLRPGAASSASMASSTRWTGSSCRPRSVSDGKRWRRRQQRGLPATCRALASRSGTPRP
jgi:SAM-dependent methyltransferase